MILSNDGFVAFHYRSYGTFFLHKNRPIISIGDLPTTNIIEPLFVINLFFNKIIHFKFVWLSFPYEILLKYFFNLLFVKKITNI